MSEGRRDQRGRLFTKIPEIPVNKNSGIIQESPWNPRFVDHWKYELAFRPRRTTPERGEGECRYVGLPMARVREIPTALPFSAVTQLEFGVSHFLCVCVCMHAFS